MGEADMYRDFLQSIRVQFAAATAAHRVLFVLHRPSSLFDVFLKALPTHLQQFYTCRSCQLFLERYGDLVAIDQNGHKHSALWNLDTTPPLFYTPVAKVLEVVERRGITDVFLSSDKTWGTPSNLDRVKGCTWYHMAVEPPAAFLHNARGQHFVPSLNGTRLDADQAMAQLRTDHSVLARSCQEFSVAHATEAVRLLSSGRIYRSDACLPQAEWFLAHLNRREDRTSSERQNLDWLATATAPKGFSGVRGSLLGSLLGDIKDGTSFDGIKAAFERKVDPTRYQRAQAAPAAGAVKQAEKLVAELGIAPALARRYARTDEIQALWRPQGEETKPAAAGVFAHIRPKDKPVLAAAAVATAELPAQKVTWDKFARTVLPTATRIEAQVPAASERFMALVTAQDPTAPPILQWDRLEARNPTSWYYGGGADAEIQRRVLRAGGKHSGVDIRASLMWNNRNDLDLHAQTPQGGHIYFGNKRVGSGWLDVDMNVRGETTEPVENIRWGAGEAGRGRYRFSVQNYRYWERNQLVGTRFTVELEVFGQIYRFEGVTSGTHKDHLVAEFTYSPGVGVAWTYPHSPALQALAPQAGGKDSAESWNLAAGSWTPVSAVALSPNVWGHPDKPTLLEQAKNRHVFFLLEGCQDTVEGRGRGFLVEMLRGDLREIRSTLEAFAASATIEGAKDATACGLGFKEDPARAWPEIVFRVTDRSGGKSLYKLDRWD